MYSTASSNLVIYNMEGQSHTISCWMSSKSVFPLLGLQFFEFSHHRAKFYKNRSIGCEDIKIFSIFPDRGCRALGMSNSQSFLLAESVWRAQTHRCTVPNFVKIGRSVLEILRFFGFSRWPPPPSWIFEIANFFGYWGGEGRDASTCQISSKPCYLSNLLRIWILGTAPMLRHVTYELYTSVFGVECWFLLCLWGSWWGCLCTWILFIVSCCVVFLIELRFLSVVFLKWVTVSVRLN